MIKRQLRQEIDAVLIPWLKTKGVDSLPVYTLEEPPKNIGGDLACNIAMLLAKQLKTNPKILASELSALLASSLNERFSRVEVAGAGFLNFILSPGFLAERLGAVLREKDDFGRSRIGGGEKIMVEFVSANPTGPLHIGHGRGAAIGDSLARVLELLGYDVQREYYLNDVGNQMQVLARSVEARYRSLKGEPCEFPEDGYKGDYIVRIAENLVARGDTGTIDFKAFAVAEILNTIKQDLADFDVRFDGWFSEATIAAVRNPDLGGRTFVEVSCDRLKEQGYAYEQEGALWFASSKFGDDKDRVLRRSDGRFTYLASDIAYHKNKLERGFTKMVDLWGADHHGYVARMKAAVQSLGAAPEALTVILYQLVSLLRQGQPVAMSTRAGEFVTLREVLDEVGKDACRFFFLLRAPDSPLEFDLELAKKQSSENPVFYVQYVHARCHSIFREAATRGIPTGEAESGSADLSILSAAAERELAKKLILFPDTLELCLKTLSPHHLTTYLMELSDAYHRFYEQCRVLVDDRAVMSARLALVRAVTVVSRNGLRLLGVSAPERM